MSRIDELIREMCPDGVPYVPLREVCNDFIVPMRDRPKQFDGTVPWCRIEDIERGYLGESKTGLAVTEQTISEMNLKVMPAGTVIASCSASLGTYAIATQPLITNQTFIGLVCGPKLINRFLFHVLHTKTLELAGVSNSGTIPYISRKKFEHLRIQLPPLFVQEEIVQILDRLSSLVDDSIVGLPAEISARRKQYEYYRDKLLTFEELRV